MYNEKRKQQFLEEKNNDTTMSANLKDIFFASERKEKKIERDICEWTSKEILNFYRYLDTPYVQSLIMIHSRLREYANWCLSNGLIKDNQNHFNNITTNQLCKCCNSEMLVEKMITREELLADIQDIPNEQDKFILLGVFEGIPMTDNIMADVKIADLDGNELHLKNGKVVKISTDLSDIIKRADEETTYESLIGEHRVMPHDLSYDTVIKPIAHLKPMKVNMAVAIPQRYRKALTYIDHDGISAKTMAESGRIDMIKRKAAELNLDPETVAYDKKYRDIHEAVYGRIPSQKVYKKTYGVLLNAE